MPIFTVAQDDADLFLEHGDPSRKNYQHRKGMGLPSNYPTKDGHPDFSQRVASVEHALSDPALVAARSSNVMTEAEKNDPRFQEFLTEIRARGGGGREGATLEERANAVALARAYRAAEVGDEGFPYPGSMLKHRGSVYESAPGKGDGLTPERARLHDTIVAHFLSKFTEPQVHPLVVVTGGLPGAGKSFGLRGVKEYEGLLNVNSDDIKALLPEYNGANAGFLHEESDLIATRVFREAVKARQSMILDVTMKSLGEANKGITNGLAGRLSAMRDSGYEVQLVFIDVSIDTSVRQAVARYFEQGRFVPPNYIRGAQGKGASKNLSNSKNFNTFVSLRERPGITGWKHYVRHYKDKRGARLIDKGGNPRTAK